LRGAVSTWHGDDLALGAELWRNRGVGMCAIYTAIKPPSAEELIILARDNEAKTYGPQRCTVGRKAIAQLVLLVAPTSHAALATAVLERDLWGFLTPAATRGNHAVMLTAANPDLAVPTPLWPESVEMACLVGAAPSHYLGNNLVMVPAEIVAIAVAAFEKHEASSDEAAYVNEFFRAARDREDAVLLHWDYR
jgi:hypothetical protein